MHSWGPLNSIRNAIVNQPAKFNVDWVNIAHRGERYTAEESEKLKEHISLESSVQIGYR